MKTLKVLASGALALALLSGCSNMTRTERNTALGAATGAAVGGVLSGGDALGTVGGAAVGGLIGNQIK